MKVELIIPSNLSEITLGQYQEYLLKEEPDTEHLLSCFLNLTSKQLNHIKATDIDYLVNHLNGLFSQEHKHVDRFTLNGVTYGFIPNLDDITYGENKDVTSYINDWQEIHKAMAVLYRPIKHTLGSKYTIEEYTAEEDVDLMRFMPLSAVMGSMVFFYNLTNELLKAIPNYLEKEMVDSVHKQTLVENGAALEKSIHLLKETSADLMRLQTYRFTGV